METPKNLMSQKQIFSVNIPGVLLCEITTLQILTNLNSHFFVLIIFVTSVMITSLIFGIFFVHELVLLSSCDRTNYVQSADNFYVENYEMKVIKYNLKYFQNARYWPTHKNAQKTNLFLQLQVSKIK